MNFLDNLKKFQLISVTNDIYKIKDIIKIRDKLGALLGGKKLILFIGDNDEYSIIFYIVSLSLKHCLIPISINASKKSIKDILNNFKPEIIFTKNTEKFKGYKKIYSLSYYSIFQKKNIITKINKNLSLLLSTSGSTGNSKFVKITYKNLISNGLSIKKYLKLNSSDSTITTLPIHYSYGISVINSHLLADAKIYINKLSFFDRKFWNILSEKKITNFSGVPFHFEILHKMNIDKLNLKSIRFCTQAGGKLDAAIIKSLSKKFFTLNKKFFVMYGQTEASPRISYADEKDLMKYPDTVGRVIPGGKIFIRNKKKIGEILYKGNNIFRGYASKRADLTYLKKINILRTGDIGLMKKDMLFITGRLSRFIKLHGVRINLDILEKYLNDLNINCKCIFTNNTIFVFIINNLKNEIEIKSMIKKDFEININLIKFIKIENFPYTNNKKIDYIKLNENILQKNN